MIWQVFLRIEIFLQICIFCNAIPCPKIEFLIFSLQNWKWLSAWWPKLAFQAKDKCPEIAKKLAIWALWPLQWVAYHTIPKGTNKVKSQKIELRNVHLGQKLLWMQISASIPKFPKWTMKGPKISSMLHCAPGYPRFCSIRPQKLYWGKNSM